MKIIKKVSYNSAFYICKQLGRNHLKRSILYFGFQAIYGDAMKFAAIIIASLALDAFLTTVTVAVSFALLRRNAGGFHLKTEFGCTIFTVIICVTPGYLLSRLTPDVKTGISFLVAIYIYSFISILKYAPKGCENRPITLEYEIKKFKKKSIQSLILLCSSSIVLLSLNQFYISFSVCIGCLLEVLTINPFIFAWVERKKTFKLY